MNYLLRLLPYALLGAIWYSNTLSGWWIALGPLTVFGIHPLLDNLIRNKVANDDGPESVKYLNFTLYILPIAITLFLYQGVENFMATESTLERVLLIIGLGTGTGGLGIVGAHELVHRPIAWQRGLGVYLMALVNYTHFRIEHVHGHHKYVSTPDDPATAPFGMNLYAFLPKTLIGSLKSAWDWETNRIKRKTGLDKVLANRMYHYLGYFIALSALFYGAYGVEGLMVFYGQSAFAIFLLEVINYIEHYGLERKRLANGNWEPVKEWHSWDCDYAVTNFSLFNIGKHSNHHARASVEFPYLENKAENPKLSFGYSTAVLLALLPPLWKMIMDPKVIERRNYIESNGAKTQNLGDFSPRFIAKYAKVESPSLQ